MQRTLIEDLKPGVIIAKDIHNRNGVMLIPKGTVSSTDIIRHVEKTGVREIYVENEHSEEQEAITNFQKSLDVDDILFHSTKTQAQKQIKKTMMKINSVGKIQMDKINFIIEDIIEQLLAKRDIVLSLSRLRSIDNYTYEHSLNVCVLSLVLGIDLNMDKSLLKILGTGAMMHDVGKLVVSEDILKKPSQLTDREFEEIRKHTDYGYEILRNSNVSEETAAIALNHHEKYDGTGYNKKLMGENIPLFSRIVAVADVYDAMSNDRVYRKRMQPNTVYREIARQSGKHFDSVIIEKLFRHLSIYPVGTGVILNTNHKGVVIAQNSFLPESPVIRVFKKDLGTGKVVGVDINLSQTKYLYIKDTF
jgi:putative nucleotidyltransferase with HDIG domain